MKTKQNYGFILSKPVVLLVTLVLSLVIFTSCSCSGVDPNVKQDEQKKTESYKIETTAPAEDVDSDTYAAYGDGLLDPVTLKGKEVDVSSFAVRSFELAYLLGSGSFKDPAKLPVDLLTQFGFAHISFDELYQIPRNKLLMRKADAEDIEKQLDKYFGKIDTDLKQSTLYNKGKKKFEMWLPDYGTNVYYRVDAADVSKNKVEIITTFFNEAEKSSKLGRTTLTVKIKDGKPVISSLKVG